jgi:hypothetical protein
MTRRELLQMALDALRPSATTEQQEKAATTLEAELAKPEPEPAGCFIETPGNEWVKYSFKQFADTHAKDYNMTPLYRKDDL